MITGLLGIKIGMTQFFSEDGESIPVTVVQAGPVKVIQKKEANKDGYEAVQIGFDELSKSRAEKLTKPEKMHFKNVAPMRYIKEMSASEFDAIEIGQQFDVSIFKIGDHVDVAGTSKGKGFSGVMRRHNFSGGPGSHGHRFNRGTGSIGQSATPARVMKNKKMPGQYGNTRKTIQNLEIIDINQELNVIMIKG
ncbi:MAG: 50S ribosomal protein L3, partial [Deltaproteobacteria bacterium]|nr:50S ribosomal protein L3 [Deltaproteobacteria bacterium]